MPVAQMADASAWLADRDELLDRDGSAPACRRPERLHQAYRAYGGGAEAESELESEREVVEAYVAAAARVNAERGRSSSASASSAGTTRRSSWRWPTGSFTDGDLRGAIESIAEAERLVDQRRRPPGSCAS